MNKGRCRDERVTLAALVGDVQSGAALRHGCIDGQRSPRELRQYMLLQPRAQHRPLGGILALDGQHAKLQLHDCDSRNKELGCIDGFSPCRNIRIRFASPNLPQLGHHVGVENEHHVKSAGWVSMVARGGSNSMSATSGIARESAMLRRCSVSRWYSSMLNSTWAGLPRSVMNTGPFLAAFFARLTS